MAEECGVDSVFVSDHLQPWRHDGGHAPFAMTWLGARTERIVMGTSVLTPTFRYHPGIVAQAFATLGCLFPDRVVRGIGTGESFNEAALGLKSARRQGTLHSVPRGRPVDQTAVGGGPGHLRGGVLPH